MARSRHCENMEARTGKVSRRWTGRSGYLPPPKSRRRDGCVATIPNSPPPGAYNVPLPMNLPAPPEEGQVLTGPQFSEPMRVVTAAGNGLSGWNLGLGGCRA